MIDAVIEVQRALGPGFLESIYEEALAVELTTRQIPSERQKPLTVMFIDRAMDEGRIDPVVGGGLLIELKAVEALAPIHEAQVISYLKAMGRQLGLLIDFNVPVLRSGIQRVVLS